MLCWFADWFSIFQRRLTFDVAHWPGDEICGPLSALFQAAAYHLPTVSPSAFPVFVY
jgi:hypothetical protein